jgi:hypothetical protein
MPNKIIKLLASDFKDTDFGSSHDCPFARAAKRALGDSRIYVGLSGIHVSGETIAQLSDSGMESSISNSYTKSKFVHDSKRAEEANFSSDVVIRELEVELV